MTVFFWGIGIGYAGAHMAIAVWAITRESTDGARTATLMGIAGALFALALK